MKWIDDKVAASKARAAAQAEAARQARIAALRSTLSDLKNKLNKLNEKKEQYNAFLANLSVLNEKAYNCSINVNQTYEYAKEGIVSEKISPKFENIKNYSNRLAKNSTEVESIIEDVKRKIDKMEEEVIILKSKISSTESALASIGG